jgi:hypothetical protein
MLQLWLCRYDDPCEPESEDVFELEFDDVLPAVAIGENATTAVTETAAMMNDFMGHLARDHNNLSRECGRRGERSVAAATCRT